MSKIKNRVQVVEQPPEIVLATWLKSWEGQHWKQMATITRTTEGYSFSRTRKHLRETLGNYRLLTPNDVHLETAAKTDSSIDFFVKMASINTVLVSFKITVVKEGGLWYVDPATLKARRQSFT